MADVMNMTSFSTIALYLSSKGTYDRVTWRKLVCKNLGLPRWVFILQLGLHTRLTTRDRLFKWGITTDTICHLCGVKDESIDHLLVECDESAYIWGKLLQWQHIYRSPMQWSDEIKWVEQQAKGRSPRAQVYRMVLAGVVYHLWAERNQRVFQQKRQPANLLIKVVIQEVHFKARGCPKVTKWLDQFNCYPV
ncbi:uncharacterized protein LOC132031654 [Lycium ferocissimum]|uniref:uncharacterized protein LOC132031654 n=1 Tax=Lycium ferocissimum TaxID=112874 RepID=UPI002814F8D4|nr:uncharacterized protein LOC132031654 [Lycium ferocissimum]